MHALQAAAAAGTTLKEGFEVQGEKVSFNKASGMWTVTSAEVRAPSPS